jgi:hypothetical protein
MNGYILGDENFSALYKSLSYSDRSITWIYFTTDKNHKVYLNDWSEWLTVQNFCIKHEANITSVGLRFRGNHIEVDIPSYARGVYVVKSAVGKMGFESRQSVTIGIIDGNVVRKTHWLVPELIEDLKFVDDIESCHKPAIVFNAKKQ